MNNNYKDSLPKHVDCTLFETKEDAYHWMEIEHTGENAGIGSVKWDSESNDRFKSLVSGTKLSNGVQLLDYMRHINLDVHNISVTNVQRLLSTPYVREQVGLHFDDGTLNFTQNNNKVISNLVKVSDAMNKSDFKVSKIYKLDQRKEWIDDILVIKRTSKRKQQASSKKKEQKSTNDRLTLIHKSVKFSITTKKINLIYLELKKLKVDEYRNAVAVLFRVFIEMSVNYFIFTKNPDEFDINEGARLRIKLSAACDYMLNNQLLTKNELKPIRTAASNHNSIYSVNTFNSYIHNLVDNPIASDLKLTWDNYELFIEKLWEE